VLFECVASIRQNYDVPSTPLKDCDDVSKDPFDRIEMSVSPESGEEYDGFAFAHDHSEQ